MRDRAAVNGKAMRTLGVLYPNVIDIGCFSHMLDLVGDNFKTPSLWSTGWSFTSIATKQDWFGEKRGGVSGSVKNRLCFRGEMFQVSWKCRCCPQEPCKAQMSPWEWSNQSPDWTFCHNRCWWIFRQGYYTLEGDGPLALTCYNVLSTVINPGSTLANTHAIACQLAFPLHSLLVLTHH